MLKRPAFLRETPCLLGENQCSLTSKKLNPLHLINDT